MAKIVRIQKIKQKIKNSDKQGLKVPTLKTINPEKTTEKDGESYTSIQAYLEENNVITECSQQARQLYEKSRYGVLLDDGRVQLTLLEAYYLHKKNKVQIYLKKKLLSNEDLRNCCVKTEKNFWTRHIVYNDFRTRGYIIKTALKFGAEFRVYDKGILPGQDHAKWIVFPVKETETMTWYEFAAKNRVAHSTKKRLLIAICDEENSVTYYEVRWTRP